ncbi:MAG: membrane protein insertase YidC [Betaproteobacteria bacterium]|nr:MAG: membrane protein insertase YidC [Betaproteobacteria bacterium]
MDTQRLILFFVFSFSLLLLWDAWQKEHRPPVAAIAQSAQQSAAQATVPSPSVPKQATTAPPQKPGDAIPPTKAVQGKHEKLRVKTDNLVADIDLQGGDIVRLEFLKQKDTLDEKLNFVLLTPEFRYAAQSGLIGPGLPTHKTVYSADAREYALTDGQDKLQVRLEAAGPEGVKTVKTLTFHRSSYAIDIAHEIVNGSATPLAAHAYFQLLRDSKSPPGDSAMLNTYTGPAIYTEQEKFHKLAFGDLDKGKASVPRATDNGWIAMLQHYFVSAWLPKEKTQREYYAKRLEDNLYSVGVIVPVAVIAPNTSGSVSVSLYAGPQEQDALKSIAPGLDLVVDYGWLTVVAAPLFWLLQFLYKWVGNWGVAIILLTVLIKAVFFPLSAASYKSMAKMKLVTPRMTKLREQYGNDRARLNQAMMDLYKTEKINPLGGCLPIVVQIPVFISLYWVLLASVELRHAPFYLWIHDLSAQDPYYVLPLLMMGSMVIQTKLNPVPPDPVQAKVMMIMPFAFGVMFFFFPAGLVLYWLVNNILSIAQQWQITRMIEGGKTPARR